MGRRAGSYKPGREPFPIPNGVKQRSGAAHFSLLYFIFTLCCTTPLPSQPNTPKSCSRHDWPRFSRSRVSIGLRPDSGEWHYIIISPRPIRPCSCPNLHERERGKPPPKGYVCVCVCSPGVSPAGDDDTDRSSHTRRNVVCSIFCAAQQA